MTTMEGDRVGRMPRRTRVIAMLNQKGGVGKTTSAVNLGAAIAQLGKRVCLIDLDPQAHLTLHLGIDPDQVKHTVYDLLIDPERRADEAVIREARPNLDALLAEVDLAGAETELTDLPGRESVLKRKLAPIVDQYDLVVIDCPPSLGLLTLNALTFATEIVVPMQAHFLALQGVGRLLETVGLVGRSVNPELRVSGIVLCMHEGQTTLAREIVADLDEFFAAASEEDVPWRDCRVLRPPIRRNIKLAEAPSFGQTIFDYAPWCRGALDYRKLAEHLIAESPATAKSTTNRIAPVAPIATPTPENPAPAVAPSEIDTNDCTPDTVPTITIEPKSIPSASASVSSPVEQTDNA